MILKKPKFWDYKKPNIYSYLLYPIAILLQSVNLLIRNRKKNDFKIKTICLGNIYIGGTGKTSLSIKLNDIFTKKNIKSCFVKKYYENQIDEQKLLKKNGKLFLAKNRVKAIKEAENENYDIAILDDGLQDKSINSDISIVCFNNINWIGNGMTIPAGPLRENINRLKKYDNIFLNGNMENLEKISKKILSIHPKANIHLGKYVPTNLKEFNKEDSFFVFSGIGNHETFVSMLKNAGLSILKDFEFPDHFQYKKSDINKIILEANDSNCKIITTEKDYLRLEDLNSDQIKFIKSEIKIQDEEKLLNVIL